MNHVRVSIHGDDTIRDPGFPLNITGIGQTTFSFIENQNFIPIDTPSPKEHLRKEGLSEKFIEYLKVFKGFVEE